MSSQDDPFEIAQRQMERLWRDLVYQRLPSAHFAEHPWVPPADVVVTENDARVIVELAGVPRETVRVRLLGNRLEVRGRRQAPSEPDGAHYHQAEIYFGEFLRVIELPWEADEHGIEAVYQDGMLEIRVQPVRAPRRTEVRIHRHAP